MTQTSPAADGEIFDFDLPPEPYPGLRPFEKHEWPIFFGRELVVGEVIDRLIGSQFVTLHGDSGCGKSSLIRAGVMPRLERDHARGGATWRTTAMLPRNAPLRNLAAALARLEAPAESAASELELRRLLNFGTRAAEHMSRRLRLHEHDYICLLIDQFEEIFQYGAQGYESEAQQFIDVLVGLQRARAPGLHVVVTLRSEFIGSCAHYHGLAEAINDTQFLLPHMDKRALMRAVREPARLFGGWASQDFVEHVVSTAFTQSQLPLLQHALMRLKQAAVADHGVGGESGWQLTRDLYEDLTGGRGATKLLNDHADGFVVAIERMERPYESALAPKQILERALKALTEIDAQGRAIRRPLPITQLAAETGVSHRALLEVLAPLCEEKVSFLRIYGEPPFQDTEIVDFSHEALIRTWGTLSEWMLEEAADGRSYERLRHLAEEFDLNPQLTLGRHETRQRVRWWRAKAPTTAWTDRYGGGKALVEELLEESDRKARRDNRRYYVGAGLAGMVIAFSAYIAYEWYDARAVTARYRALVESDTQTVNRALDTSRALTDVYDSRNARVAAPLRKLLSEPSSKTVLSDDERELLKSYADSYGPLSPAKAPNIVLYQPPKAASAPFDSLRGKLQLPVRGNRVLSFGQETPLGLRSKGISIAAEAGATVVAPADGLVVYAGEFRTYGQLLIISPGGGYHILLAGLAQIDVQVGQSVLMGETVGVAASAPENPVVTVEIRKDQRPIDPDPWWQGKSPPTESPERQPVKLPATAGIQPQVPVAAQVRPTGLKRVVIGEIAGAPGDAGISLRAALRDSLTSAGITVLEGPSPDTYRIEGEIRLGEARDGLQAVAIEWVVKAPNGDKLGTVAQKNDIPEGSLDGPWGRVAEQAANAAMKGILQLLPQR